MSSEVMAALMGLMDNQTPVSDFLGTYRLLIVGGPGMDKADQQRFWSKQLKYVGSLTKGAEERRLLVLNDSTRSDNPYVDKRIGALLLRRETQAKSDQQVVKVEMVNLRYHPEMRPIVGGGWQSILVGLDGTVKQRWDRPVKRKELFKLIDVMPMRQRELAQ
ncbi:MAG: DUF4174 domain-containing protein [Pseudomonadota bacterium]